MVSWSNLCYSFFEQNKQISNVHRIFVGKIWSKENEQNPLSSSWRNQRSDPFQSMRLYRVSQKKYTKSIKRNLKLITLIINMWLFLHFTQSNVNFEPSFVEIHQVLREPWHFEHEFQARNFGQLWIFVGIKFANKLFIYHSHFEPKSKWQGKTSYLLAIY